MFDGIQAVIHQVLTDQCGVPEPIEYGDRALFFRWCGYEYDINTQSASWLCIGVTLVESNVPGSNPANRLDLHGFDRDDRIARVTKLNSDFHFLKFNLRGDKRLKIQWASFLFGSMTLPEDGDPEPMPPGYELPIVSSGKVAAVLEFAMAVLSSGIRAAFQAFGQEPSVMPRGVPFRNGQIHPDSQPLFVQAIQRNGYSYGKALTPLPEYYILDHLGLSFRLNLNSHAGGGFALQMEFLEEDRIKLESSVINVYVGAVDDGMVELCQAMAGDLLGMMAFAYKEHGYVVLSCAGILPQDDPEAIFRLLPVLVGMLASFAGRLFAEAGSEFRTFAENSDRRRSIVEGEPGLTWQARAELHAWEKYSGRILSERLKGQYGQLFSGYVFPTDKGEVQIDHVLVCEVGVFAIKCKSFGGSIRGSRNGPWNQVVRGYDRRIGASWGQNPADQVLRGVHAVRGVLGRAESPPFVSGIVLFPNDAKLSLLNVPVNTILGTAPSAFTLNGLLDHLNGSDRDRSRDLTPSQAAAFAAVIEGI